MIQTASNPKSFPKYSLAGKVLKALKGTISMYDPDTLHVAFKLAEDQPCYQYALRVEGIDSIENKIKKTDLNTLSEVQKQALFQRREDALTYMSNLLSITDMVINLGQMDKFGRVLSQLITSDGVDVSKDLIRRNLVFAYQGDTKMTLVQQAEFCLNTPSILQ